MQAYQEISGLIYDLLLVQSAIMILTDNDVEMIG